MIPKHSTWAPAYLNFLKRLAALTVMDELEFLDWFVTHRNDLLLEWSLSPERWEQPRMLGVGQSNADVYAYVRMCYVAQQDKEARGERNY